DLVQVLRVEVAPHRDQAALFAPAQRPEQHRMHHAEDGGGGADAEGEREDGRDGEAGGPGQSPEGESQVAKKGFHGHSARRADMGSMRAARRAGVALAATAVRTSRPAMAAKVSGS